MSLYVVDSLYQNLIYAVQSFAPSGILVVSGESYGIRLDDPKGKSPSISVNIDDMTDTPIELGSNGATFVCSLTINASSRLQRDALKSIVYSNLANTSFPLYNNIVSGDFTVTQYANVLPGMKLRDMPNFSSNREDFFWSAVCMLSIELLN